MGQIQDNQPTARLSGAYGTSLGGTSRGAAGAALPQPDLVDIPHLIDETRRAGTDVELEIRLPEQAAVPGALSRDAYRIVQEALTNVRKHGGGTAGRVSLAGGVGAGLHISIRNQMATTEGTPSTVPGAGAGLIGLRERVVLNGGTLRHGPDGSGNFVVEATLRW